MEKILILADFDAGAPFLRELAALSSDRAVIISADERLFAPASSAPSSEIYSPSAHSAPLKRALASGLAHSGFTAYFADATRADLIAPFCAADLQIIYILFSNERSVRLAYDAVRAVLATVPIAIVSNDAAYANDSFCSAFSPRAMVAARLVDELPSTPHIARFIGAGAGEIMQVKVPPGSMFAHKHLHALTQKEFRIALVYRRGEAILPRPSTLLLPGDELLLVGEPARLRTIHARVRATVGQFPQPYAGQIAAIVDMQEDSNIRAVINATLLLLTRTNASAAQIHVLNARASSDLALLKALRRSAISVHFCYEHASAAPLIAQLAARSNYLFVASARMFGLYSEEFYAVHMPILRLGSGDFSSVDKVCALSQNGSGVEELTGVLLDFGAQLGASSEVYLYETENSKGAYESLLEHIDQQSKFFEHKLLLRRFERENPLLTLASERRSLCVAGFSKEVAKSYAISRRLGRFLRPQIEANLRCLEHNHTLFVPIS